LYMTPRMQPVMVGRRRVGMRKRVKRGGLMGGTYRYRLEEGKSHRGRFGAFGKGLADWVSTGKAITEDTEDTENTEEEKAKNEKRVFSWHGFSTHVFGVRALNTGWKPVPRAGVVGAWEKLFLIFLSLSFFSL